MQDHCIIICLYNNKYPILLLEISLWTKYNVYPDTLPEKIDSMRYFTENDLACHTKEKKTPCFLQINRWDSFKTTCVQKGTWTPLLLFQVLSVKAAAVLCPALTLPCPAPNHQTFFIPPNQAHGYCLPQMQLQKSLYQTITIRFTSSLHLGFCQRSANPLLSSKGSHSASAHQTQRTSRDIDTVSRNPAQATVSQCGRSWKGPLWVIQSNPPAQAGSPRAGCTRPHPGGSAISPEKETLQPPWAACSSAPSPSEGRSSSSCSDRTSHAPVCPLFPLSCRWAPPKRAWPRPPDTHPAAICRHF